MNDAMKMLGNTLDKSMPKAQYKEGCRCLFEESDWDKDGFLDLKELTTFFDYFR